MNLEVGPGICDVSVKASGILENCGVLLEDGIRTATGIDIWEYPKIRGTFLGVPIVRIVVFGGLYWGSPILGNYHIYTGGPRFFAAKKEVMMLSRRSIQLDGARSLNKYIRSQKTSRTYALFGKISVPPKRFLLEFIQALKPYAPERQ